VWDAGAHDPDRYSHRLRGIDAFENGLHPNPPVNAGIDRFPAAPAYRVRRAELSRQFDQVSSLISAPVRD
jgi:hypothetical protein